MPKDLSRVLVRPPHHLSNRTPFNHDVLHSNVARLVLRNEPRVLSPCRTERALLPSGRAAAHGKQPH